VRILYFTRANSVHDQRFMNAIVEAGHEGYALHLYKGEWPVPKGITRMEWEGVEGPLAIKDLAEVTLRLRALLKGLAPDLVQAGPLHDVAYLVALSGFKPLLATSWGFDLMKDVDSNLLYRMTARYSLEKAERLIVDAKCSAERAVRFGFDPLRIDRFPWGVDLSRFSPKRACQAESAWRREQGWQDKKVLLCLRAWEPNYGVDVLAKAFCRAVRQDQDLRLLLLGDGSQSREIRTILHDGGAEEQVFYGGRVPNDDLPRYYGAADLYVSPSHVDGSSVSLMEAMACGLPSLVSDIPANLEWVVPERNGFIFPDGDIKALERSIFEAFQADLTTLGRQARLHSLEFADWEKNREILWNSYVQTLAKRK